MPRRTTFKIPGLRAWVDNCKNVLSEEAARDIVIDLKLKGPYWTGEFEENWVVKRGAVGVGATKEPTLRSNKPFPRNISDVEIPKATGRKSITYTISNAMKYRDFALDLVPGRLSLTEPTNNAYSDQPPQDWYVKYVQAEMQKTIEKTTDRVARIQNNKKGFG
jgi:hypothetical protein